MAEMPEKHTIPSFLALADDWERNAAIAAAIGTWHREGTMWCRGSPLCADDDRDWRRAAPFYWTGGDSDPFANWHLLAEVIRALRGVERGCYVVIFCNPGGSMRVTVKSSCNMTLISQTASSFHRAACLALVAAGLVPKE